MIKTDFIKLYEELTSLNEAKADIENFINKFGEDTYDLFKKSTQRLKNKGISTDLTYHVKHTDKKDLEAILYNLENRILTKTDDITSMEGDYEYLGEGKGYKVYKINDVVASINLGAGTGWCISGRYGHYGEKNYTPTREEAEKHWNEYRSKGVEFYFFIGTANKYAIAVYPKFLELSYSDAITIPELIDTLPPIKKEDHSYVALNFEIYDEKDSLDYTIFKDLPINIIDSELTLEVKAYPTHLDIHNIEEYRKSVETGQLTEDHIDSIKSIQIHDNITEIEEMAFRKFEALETIIFPETLKVIGAVAFGNCTSLKELRFPQGVEYIEDNAFEHCINLKTIYLPDALKYVGEEAFKDCPNIYNVYFRWSNNLRDVIFSDGNDDLLAVGFSNY